jgi:hypothetical protein
MRQEYVKFMVIHLTCQNHSFAVVDSDGNSFYPEGSLSDFTKLLNPEYSNVGANTAMALV